MGLVQGLVTRWCQDGVKMVSPEHTYEGTCCGESTACNLVFDQFSFILDCENLCQKQYICGDKHKETSPHYTCPSNSRLIPTIQTSRVAGTKLAFVMKMGGS